jgi:hypothetical protein
MMNVNDCNTTFPIHYHIEGLVECVDNTCFPRIATKLLQLFRSAKGCRNVLWIVRHPAKFLERWHSISVFIEEGPALQSGPQSCEHAKRV